MGRLSETVFPKSRRKTFIRLAPLCVMIFPIFCFMLVMCYHGYSTGEEIAASGNLYEATDLNKFMWNSGAIIIPSEQAVKLSTLSGL